MKRIVRTNEFALCVIIAIIYMIFGFINPEILSFANMFAVARVGMVNFIFALSVLLVMISGGIDMSFFAIGSLSMYLVIKVLTTNSMNLPLIVIFAVAIIVGVLLGLVNAFFVDKIKLSPFIVTLGTQSLFKGFLLTFIGTSSIVNLPKSLQALSHNNLATVINSQGKSSALNISVLIVIMLYAAFYVLLNHTMIGRSIYAIGGDSVAASRIGINITKIHCLVYGIAGGIAAVGGVVQSALTRTAIPSALIGNELTIIAAVVLGGGSDKNGKGSLFGTFLGVLLLTVISNSLTTLKIPSFWQQAIMGLIIVGGTIIQSYRTPKKGNVSLFNRWEPKRRKSL